MLLKDIIGWYLKWYRVETVFKEWWSLCMQMSSFGLHDTIISLKRNSIPLN